jgi:ribosomal protein S18 acetylase RimI-like enzyme
MLREVLGGHGFNVVPYRYLARPVERPARYDEQLTNTPHRAREGDPRRSTRGHFRSRPFQPHDFSALVQLFSRAYSRMDDVRAFAPHGSVEEWRDYADSLLAGPGCGRPIPEASRIIQQASSDRLDAALLATDLGLGTGHIAQVAVDPERQGRGLGADLVGDAIDALADRGFERVTLLVSDANARARRLYFRLGFQERGSFVVAIDRALSSGRQHSRVVANQNPQAATDGPASLTVVSS